MPGLSLGLGLGFSQPVASAGGGGGELFPDPTLVDVADSTDGWQFSNGLPSFGPKGGTGPGIQALVCFDDDNAALAGADDLAFGAVVSEGHSYLIAVTFANVSAAVDMLFQIGGAGGTPATLTPANGAVSGPVVAGAITVGTAFFCQCSAAGGTFDITHISVTAA